ncbi:MAG: tyrosine-type recombinase/integrase, partial [Myxococcales bacterium]|nr:tyrosine-type recombinase/integrase [Myxococcales bacterium]
EFMGIRWPSEQTPQPDESWRLLQATVPLVQAWRDYMHDERSLAPNTLNRRVSSLSGFFRFLREAAAEMRLPITVPNPAHSQFIGREVQAPVSPTEALSAARARQLMALPEGETVLAYRDRALLRFYLYTGVRIATGCRLHVADFIDDDEDPKVRIQEKGRGKSKRVVGINLIAADALRQYIEHAALTSGPLFRPRLNPRSEKLAERAMDVSTMYRLLQSYLTQLPRAMKEHELQDGTTELRCLYSPHSIRATTATLLLDQGEDIRDVQKLLGHKHVTVTQVYDKRRRGTKDSASHRLSL